MKNSAGTAYLQIIPTTDGIKGMITKAVSGDVTSVGKSTGTSLGSKIGSFAKKAISAAAIGTFVKNSILQGAELEQNLGGTEAVFGKFAKNIQRDATEAYKNMGLSASAYMATANKMGSLFQGSGLSQQKSLDLTSQAMQRAADVASVMGIETSMAMESIAGAAKGNFTMMDNLGVAMNATTLQAYALEKGINFKWNTASNAEKAELAMKMFMDRTSQYAGNFARESEETISGSFGRMKAAAQDFLGNLVLGKDIQKSVKNLVESACVFTFDNLVPAMGNIIKGIFPALGEALVTGMPKLLSYLSKAIPEILQALITGLKTYFDGMFKKISEIMNDPKARENFRKALGSFIKELVKMIPQIVELVAEGVMLSISMVLVTIYSLFDDLGGAISKGISKMWKNAKKDVMNGINNIISDVKKKFASIKDIFKSLLNSIKNIFKNVKLKFNIKLPHFKIKYKKVSGALSKFIQPGIPHFSVDWYKNGGIFNKATIAGIGEAGSEAVVPLNKLWEKFDEMADNIVSGVAFATGNKDISQPIIVENYLFKSGPEMDKTIVEVYDRGKWRLKNA